MSIFNILKRKKKNIFARTEEYMFYAENSAEISKITKAYNIGVLDGTGFKLIQYNILIKAMRNKEIYEANLEKYTKESFSLPMEERDKFIRDKVWADLDSINAPYFEIDKQRIYIPFYSRGLNLIYNDEPTKLMDYPYNELKEKPLSTCIDLFDVYNYALYTSEFTNLIKIKVDKSSAAFYHKEFETIYIINDQGRLDISIPLFDRYMKESNDEKILTRVDAIVNAFYSNDRTQFITSLYQNKVISYKTYMALAHNASLRAIKKDRIANRGKSADEVL